MINKKDQKILEILIKNSRASLTQIGKHAGLSRENTSYHLDKLVKEGIIRSFISIINPALLGYKQYALFIQLMKMDKNKELQLSKFLKCHSNISWIGLFAGRWSIALDIYAKNDAELSKCLSQILSSFGSHIHEYSVLLVNDKNYYANKLFNSDIPDDKRTHRTNDIQLDNIDLKLLQILNKDARISYAEMSEKVNLTANAVKNRINTLRLNGYIAGYSIDINPQILGYQWYGIQLKIIKFDLISMTKLKSFLASQKSVLSAYQYVSGPWDFDVGVLVKNPKELYDFLTGLRNNLADIVRIEDFFMLFDEVSNHTLPKAVFEKD